MRSQNHDNRAEAKTDPGENHCRKLTDIENTWQLDWSMWYLGQVKYCKMSEMTLSICNGVFNIGQLAAVGMIAKVVRKKSPDFALI